PARRSTHGTSRCIIAASARCVQISIERTAILMSGLGGMTENPMTNDREVPEETLGSGAARGQEVNPGPRQPDRSQPRSEFICDKYAARRRKLNCKRKCSTSR